MKAIVFQGGGSKGSYEAGAVKALLENGYSFNCAAGTSIGSINAAIVAQGDADKLYDLWNELDVSDLYDDNKFTRLLNDNESSLREKIILTKLALDGGLDMEKGKNFLKTIISEERIRSSDIDYGLMTVNLTQKKPVSLFKKDIRKGKLLDYIFASAAFPLFPKKEIDGQKYIDGGFFDNLPINMVLDKGYDDIVAISLGENIAPKREIKKEDESKVKIFRPSEKLTNAVLNFTHSDLVFMLNLGYLDTLRALGKYRGETYYVNFITKKQLENAIDNSNCKQKLFEFLGVGTASGMLKKMCFILREHDFMSVILYFLEYIASKLEISRYMPYDVFTLSKLCMEASASNDKLILNTPRYKIASLLCETLSNA